MALVILWLPMSLWPTPVNTVGIVGDGNPKSCTEAALEAALSTGGKITFNCGPTAHTIPITSQKTIGLNITIDGQHLITLSGRNLTRLFSVISGVTLSLQQLTLANGNATLGGAIYNAGNVVITDSALINNQSSGGSGGSIYNDGKLTITNSRLSNNVAQDGLGGAIYNAGELALQNSILADNYGELAGGGILNSGTAFITQDTFINNSGNYGGGLENRGTVILENSNITSNTTTYGMGGGVHNTGQLTVTESTFAGNSSAIWQYGGGLANQGNAKITNSLLLNNVAPDGLGAGIYNNGQLTLVADTLASNQTGSGWGGGIYSAITGSLNITNTTFSGNFGGHDGGGLYTSGSAIILNSTFYNNLPNSIVTIESANISMRNSIVAGSPITNCKGTITSLGNNLEDHNTCGFVAIGDIHNAFPGLAPLSYNGGPTPTHALNPGSPAINGGANDACPVDDQRGARRPVFGVCDIGAYEYGFSTSLPLVSK
jgi:predicted outer membrane repeat protein